MSPASPTSALETAVDRSVRWVSIASATHAAQNIVALVLVLAFWVTPTELGIATLAVSLFPVLDVLADLGLSAAVIRSQAGEAEVAAVFWVNLAASLALFAALAGFAPWLAALQGHAVIGTMLVVYGSKLVLQNVAAIPEALLRRELRFKELSIIRIVGNTASFAGKVGFAVAGFGPWCFVLGPLLRTVVTVVGVQLVRPWRPRARPDLARAAELIRFGFQSSASQLLFFCYTNADYQVVGHYFGTAALGLYRAAYELVLEPARFLSDVTTQVAFPTFARLAGQPAALRQRFIEFRAATWTSSCPSSGSCWWRPVTSSRCSCRAMPPRRPRPGSCAPWASCARSASSSRRCSTAWVGPA